MSMLDNIFGVHENAMQLRQRRLSLLGENIANADTPNYKAKDLDFKALMNNERSMSTRRTHELHIDHAGGSKNGLIYRVQTIRCRRKHSGTEFSASRVW